MNLASDNLPQRVPTLTEVVQLSPTAALDDAPEAPQSVAPTGLVDMQSSPTAAPDVGRNALDDAALVQRVLEDVQRQIDLMLEYRLRDALAPLLARVADGLIRDARHELASTLRDIVVRSVAQEVARCQGR